jgi:hypothetical protein
MGTKKPRPKHQLHTPLPHPKSPVGGCDTDDDVVLVALKSIKLSEQLIQRLLPLIIAAHAAPHVSTLVGLGFRF